jgi:hypothetical protein
MAESKVTAFVLPTEAVVGTDAVHFGGFPGIWVPGQPVEVTELGFASLQDARERRDELGLPLKETKVAVGKGAMPERENHAPNQREADHGAESELGGEEEFPPPAEAVASEGGEV